MCQWLFCSINEDVFTFPCVHYFDKLSEMNLFFVGGLILVRDPRTIHNFIDVGGQYRFYQHHVVRPWILVLVADAKGHFRDGMSHFRDVKITYFETYFTKI